MINAVKPSFALPMALVLFAYPTLYLKDPFQYLQAVG